MNTLLQIKNLFQSLKRDTSKMKENVLAFACGDIMLFTMLGIPPEVADLGWKMVSTILLAVGGGIAGMLGKDLYVYVKARISEWLKGRGRKTKK